MRRWLGVFVFLSAITVPLSCATVEEHPDGDACLAKCNGCSAWAIVELDVSDYGSIVDPRVVESCPDSRARWAVTVIRRMRYGSNEYGKLGKQVKLVR